jgi:cyclic pyranopterin phosphate synthase
MAEFSHVNEKNEVVMVNVGGKQTTLRKAIAHVRVHLTTAVADQLKRDDFKSPKGPVFEVARIAGIMAAKKTGDLIPLCHPIGVDHIEINMSLESDVIEIYCTASVHAKTGVEMEALTGASVAALTIYDMCKAMSHEIRITDLELIEKTGGKSDYRKKTS